MKAACNNFVLRLVKMLAFGLSAFLSVHFGVEDSPLVQTALLPVMVCLTSLALVIAALYQLAQGLFDFIESRKHMARTRQEHS